MPRKPWEIPIEYNNPDEQEPEPDEKRESVTRDYTPRERRGERPTNLPPDTEPWPPKPRRNRENEEFGVDDKDEDDAPERVEDDLNAFEENQVAQDQEGVDGAGWDDDRDTFGDQFE